MGKMLVAVVGAVLFWYGLMVVLLAFQVSPDLVRSLSAYRTLYDNLASLHPADITTTVRIAVGVAGAVVFVVLATLAVKALPRPYLARQSLLLDHGKRGTTTIEPRALEHLARVAAECGAAVDSARGLYGARALSVDVSLRDPDALDAALRDARRRVQEAVGRHDLPDMPVDITLAGVQPPKREVR
jgi:hypothetical protein